MWSVPPWVTGRRSASRRTVTSVVSRIGIASTRSGSSIVATRRSRRRPAGREAERAEQEAEQLAAAVAHEDARPVARPQVEREEAEAGEGQREREDEDEVVRMRRRRVDREVEACDGRERRRQAVHVVEQVEGVGDPHEPEDGDRDAQHVVRHELDPQAGRDRDPGGRDLRCELRQRAQMADVVDDPCDEEQPASGQDPGELPRRLHGTDGDRERDAGGEPAGDADAAERRRGALVPALSGRLRDELGRGGGGAQEGPEGERRDRQGGDRDGRFHGGQRVATVPYDFGVEAVRRRPTIGARERLRGSAAAPGAVRHRSSGATCARSTRDPCSGSPGRSRCRPRLMLVYLVVFAVLWKAQPTETEHYWLFLLCGLPPWVFFSTSLQGGARSIVENAPIIRKVRFPRQLVPLSVVATEVDRVRRDDGDRPRPRALVPAGEPRSGLARDPGRRADRGVHGGRGPRDRVAQRHLPRRRVRRHGRAAAVVLPDAHPVPARRSARRPVAAVARRPAPLGKPADAGGRVVPDAALRGRAAADRRPLYLVVAAGVALALGAFVFRSVDDRIASEA